jgi:ribosomal protein uL22
MKYSYNQNRDGIVFAGVSDINASFKDLCNVCDAVRHKPVSSALHILEEAAKGRIALEFKRHNKYMGSRHELGGKKGRWPKKCAELVRKVLVNASANAKNLGEDPDTMHVVHAAANKTTIVPRRPPKGIRTVRTGGYGYSPSRRSDIELARIEIGIAYKGRQGGAHLQKGPEPKPPKPPEPANAPKAGSKGEKPAKALTKADTKK